MMILLGRKLLSNEDCKYVLTDRSIFGGDQVLIPIAVRRKLDWTWTRELQEVEVKIFKDNLIMALKFARVYRQHQLYHNGIQIIFNNEWYEDQLRIIETHFGSTSVSYCKFNISISNNNVHFLSGFLQDSGLNLQEFFIPKYTSLFFYEQDNEVFLEIDQDQKSLRGFCFSVFKILLREFGDEFLKINSEVVKTKIGKINYEGIIFKGYFKTAKLLGVFELGQANNVFVSKSDRFRYQKEPLNLLSEDKEVYFTTEFEYNWSNNSHVLFDDFRRFVEDYSENKYSILKVDNTHKLVFIGYSNVSKMPTRKIFFGPPGTGKSHQIKSNYPGNWPRVTFHPELDYQGFIGAYKPFVLRTAAEYKVTYRFVEEALIRAYCESWRTNAPY